MEGSDKGKNPEIDLLNDEIDYDLVVPEAPPQIIKSESEKQEGVSK